MKRALFATCLLGLGFPGRLDAQPLLVGIVRDQDGAAVAGARVVARDRAGARLAAGSTAADGTFALATEGAAALDVGCDYCAPAHLALGGDAAPIVIVRRYRALAEPGPGASDIAALPYARPEPVAALRPFAVRSAAGGVSLGLDRGSALVATAGIPAYRIADGGSALPTLPDRELERLVVADPSEGYRYGSYADGGTLDFEPQADERVAARVDGGPSESLGLRYGEGGIAAAAGASYGDGVRRARADVSGTIPVPGGTLRALAALGSGGPETDAALGAQLAAGSARNETFADVEATRSTLAATTPNDPAAAGGSLFADLRVRETGPLGLELGARVRRSTGSYEAPGGLYALAGAQGEAALYADAAYAAGGNDLRAAVGLTRIDRSSRYAANETTFAPLGTFGYARALGPHLSLTADASASTRVPTLVEEYGYGVDYRAVIPIDRDQLVEGGIAYTDLARVRAEVRAYRERIAGGGTSYDAGIGVSAAWQIAPRLALRASALAPSQALAGAYEESGYYAARTPQRTSSVWLTYESATRIDAIYESGRIDGDVNVPLGPATTLRLGRDASSGAVRYGLGLRYVR